MKFSTPLIDFLKELRKKACTPNAFTTSEIQHYLKDQNLGLAKLDRLKTIAEVLTNVTVLVMAMLFTKDVLYLAIATVIWVAGLLYLSHKMLIIILKKIQPFNIINDELKVLTINN